MSFVTRSEFREVLLSLYKDIQTLREEIRESTNKQKQRRSPDRQIAVDVELNSVSSIETRTPISEQKQDKLYQFLGLLIQVLTLAAVAAYAVITGKMWKEMHAQTQTSQRQLEQSQRAWLKVSITADSGVEFTNDGGARITVRPHIQNIGNSAATNIITSVKMILAPMNNASGGRDFFDEPIKQQSELCDKITATPIISGKTQSDFEQVIFPNDTDESVGHGLAVSKSEIDKTKKSVVGKSGPEELLAPFVVGCVDYQFATAIQHHQTGFVYMLQHHDRTLPPNIYPIRGIRVGHSISASDVEIQRWAFGGFYAY